MLRQISCLLQLIIIKRNSSIIVMPIYLKDLITIYFPMFEKFILINFSIKLHDIEQKKRQRLKAMLLTSSVIF